MQLRFHAIESTAKLFVIRYAFPGSGDRISQTRFSEAYVQCYFWCKTTEDLIDKRARRRHAYVTAYRPELKRRVETLKQCYAEGRKITKEIAENQGRFAQVKLLGFVLSERYAFTPSNFASAAAGLPHMGWRTSMRRCSRVQYCAKTSINYLIFEAVKTIWKEPVQRAKEAASEVRHQINTRKQFVGLKEYLSEHWHTLEDVTRKVWNSVAPHRTCVT